MRLSKTLTQVLARTALGSESSLTITVDYDEDFDLADIVKVEAWNHIHHVSTDLTYIFIEQFSPDALSEIIESVNWKQVAARHQDNRLEWLKNSIA